MHESQFQIVFSFDDKSLSSSFHSRNLKYANVDFESDFFDDTNKNINENLQSEHSKSTST